MSYNILNKNVQFQGSDQGTIENIVDTHSTQTIGGNKTITHLTGTNVQITNDMSLSNNLQLDGRIGIGGAIDANYNAVITVDDSDSGGGLFIDDNETNRGISALKVQSENTHTSGYVAYFEGRRVGYFNQDIDDGFGATFFRNRGVNAETLPLVAIIDAGTGNTQPTLRVSQYGSGPIMTLQDGASVVVTFDATGSMGLGTATPANKLQVIGDIKASTNISASAFYGDGANITGIVGSSVQLASGGGIVDSSGLKLGFDGMATETSINNTDTLFVKTGGSIKSVQAQYIAGLSVQAVSAYTNQPSANALIKSNGNNKEITADPQLTFNGGALEFGNGANASISVATVSGTNITGKNLTMTAGAGTGTGVGGGISFNVAEPGVSGGAANPHTVALEIGGGIGKPTTVHGRLIANQPASIGLDNNAAINIDTTMVQVASNDGASKTGIRFNSFGTAGQIIIVKVGGTGDLTFHNNETDSLVRGINANNDTMKANGTYVFVSDGSFWVFIGGGAATNAQGLQS